jgi:diaminobutyrate-2-oxoglutarate transaminase
VLVADEVQTGLGRTGTLWGSDGLGLEPDVLVLSKAIGGGQPLAVIVYRAELDVWEPGAHAGTFRGNQLGLAAGAATIRHVVEHGLAERAAGLGERLRDGLRERTEGLAVVGDVRGRGLMVGVELVDPDRADADGVPLPDGALASAVQRAMLDLGVLVEIGGRDGAVVRFLPPLVVEAEHVDRMAGAFGTAVWSAWRGT